MNDYDYDVEKKEFPWKKLVLSILSIVILIILILLFLRFCGSGSLRDDLLEAGKEYFEKDTSLLPDIEGQCVTVTAEELIAEGLLDAAPYESCGPETLVKVCYLENGSYQYTPILSCDDEKSEFDKWKDGDISDLTPDESDVQFLFKGYELNLGTKLYYPGDKTIDEVKEYYDKSPADGYTYTEDEQTGYKWYTNSNNNVYYNNGEYTSLQPAGYPHQGSESSVTNVSDTRPADASYRTIEEVTLYSYSSTPKQVYACGSSETPVVIVSEVLCGLRTDSFVIARGLGYSCDGNSVQPTNTPCQEKTDWSTASCPESTGLINVTCDTKSSYSYTDKTWQWYKTESGRKYYPSGASSASGENTYYVEQPVSGAIKDESTMATVHKYYKIEENIENPDMSTDPDADTTFEEWVSITPGFVSEEDLIEAFNDLEYDVLTLEDIIENEKIKFELKMQYRDLIK